MEKTRAQALKELRALLSEVLSTAVSSTEVPDAFKSVHNWERLIAQTETRFAEAWRQRFATGMQKREEHRALSLLADDEQDQQVLSERFVNEVLDENREPLDDLDHQLAAMSGVQPDETRENPLGPSAWADGIRTGVRELECSPDDRDWLMEQIMPLLADRVGLFYSAMSKQLAAAGFAGTRRVRGQAGQPKAVTADGPPPAPVAGGFAPEMVEFRNDAGAAADGDGGESLDHLLGLLSAQRAPVGGMAGGGAGQGGGQPSGPAWSQDDIFSILGLLQSSYTGAADDVSPVASLQQAIGNTASRMGLSGGVQAMPGPAQDTLALVSMLFEVLLEGKRLDERARSQLARLIIPFIRIAMSDRRLFMQSTHPARRVLNLLVEAFETAGADAPQYKALRDAAFKAIDRIVADFSDDLSLFEELETSLATETEACRHRAELAERRAAEAQNGRERREHARDSVARYLSESLFGKLVPTVLLDFLVGPWQHHQNLALLNDGDDAAEVAANQQLLQDLVEASGQGAITDTATWQPRIAEVLHSSGQSAEAAADLVRQLSAAFAARASSPVAGVAAGAQVEAQTATLAAALAPPPAAKSDAPVIAPGPPPPVDLVGKYTDAPIGTWLDLVGEDGRVNSAKISWTSPISGRRILSNRRGQRILVASPEELAAMELDGRIRPRHSESAFEQAMHSVTRRLESAPAAEAVAAG